MPRPRKPQHLHIVQGTFRRDRHGPRDAEPEVFLPLGDPPAGWNAGAKTLWHELAAQVPAGVATGCDRTMFEVLIRLVAKMREGPDVMTPALAAQIRTACAVFGMTPADRSRVMVPRLPAGNPFAELD